MSQQTHSNVLSTIVLSLVFQQDKILKYFSLHGPRISLHNAIHMKHNADLGSLKTCMILL
jgi:hypothetical protein